MLCSIKLIKVFFTNNNANPTLWEVIPPPITTLNIGIRLFVISEMNDYSRVALSIVPYVKRKLF